MIYNVYEQRFPINKGRVKGVVVWDAHLALIGQITVHSGCPLDQARKRFFIRAPIVHRCDSRGEEVYYHERETHE